jgi:heat shock protein HtpX
VAAQAYGLYGHIRSNRIRSRALLIGLFLLAYLTSYGVILIVSGSFAEARTGFLFVFPVVTLVVAGWILIGFRYNVGLIGLMSGARPAGPQDHPEIRRLLENLCISRGMRTPKLAVLQSDALNAFASGVNDDQFTVTVTTGLLANLDAREIEAVLAHELTHIRNGDVRMMIIAVLIAGIVSLVGELVFRGVFSGSRSSSSDRKGGGGVAILIGLAIVAVSWLLAIVVRLSLSRTREYLADAGAVELTKNPDALISALLKIAGRADIDGIPSGLMDMCFENDPDDVADLFSTHPSVTKRVQALVQVAGGHAPQQMPPRPPSMATRPDLPSMVAASGKAGSNPWGAAAPVDPAG